MPTFTESAMGHQRRRHQTPHPSSQGVEPRRALRTPTPARHPDHMVGTSDHRVCQDAQQAVVIRQGAAVALRPPCGSLRRGLRFGDEQDPMPAPGHAFAVARPAIPEPPPQRRLRSSSQVRTCEPWGQSAPSFRWCQPARRIGVGCPWFGRSDERPTRCRARQVPKSTIAVMMSRPSPAAGAGPISGSVTHDVLHV